MRLKDKVAIVTGSASGIGKAIALAFAREGAIVMGADLNAEGGEETAREIEDGGGRAAFIETDVSETEPTVNLIDKTLERFGSIDIMVNNAGIEVFARLADTEEAMWDRLMAVNLRGVFLGTKYVVPKMLENGGGVIVNTASVAGIRGVGGLAAYNAAKGGVVLLTKNTAMDYGSRNIRANCICPGFISTPMVDAVMSMPGAEGTQGKIIDLCPEGRLGRPEEVASCVVFLASDESSYVNGHALVVDGGMSAGWQLDVEEMMG